MHREQQHEESPKFEYRNPKQIQNTIKENPKQNTKKENLKQSLSAFEILRLGF
jgi:hypothetical protein